jgi:hypothetical protein
VCSRTWSIMLCNALAVVGTRSEQVVKRWYEAKA